MIQNESLIKAKTMLPVDAAQNQCLLAAASRLQI